MVRLSNMIRNGFDEKKSSLDNIDNRNKKELYKDYESLITLRNISDLRPAKASHISQLKMENEVKTDVSAKKSASEYAELFYKAYNYVTKYGLIVKQGGKIDLKEGYQIILKMVEDRLGIEALYGKAISANGDMDFISSNMVNAGIYSIKLGIGLKFSKEKLVALGLAGLVHDFGMFKIDEKILKKEGKLSDQESAEIKKAPIYGYKIINDLGDKYLWLAEVLLQEHEREDGHGYPRGLKGNEISEYAKIVGLADVFEGITHKRPHRKRLLPFDATGKILRETKGLFDTNIVRALLQNLGCFPLESYVKLSSNAIAKVVDINKKFPLRPTVEIIFDPQGNIVCGKKTANLEKNNLLYITGAVYEEDLPQR